MIIILRRVAEKIDMGRDPITDVENHIQHQEKRQVDENSNPALELEVRLVYPMEQICQRASNPSQKRNLKNKKRITLDWSEIDIINLQLHLTDDSFSNNFVKIIKF